MDKPVVSAFSSADIDLRLFFGLFGPYKAFNAHI
jgi:L-lactate utilization protein LutC